MIVEITDGTFSDKVECISFELFVTVSSQRNFFFIL